VPYATTNVGSVPHLDARVITQQLIECLDIPAWPQLPRKTFLENMYTQFSASLPALVLDEGKEKIHFNTTGDFTQAITTFYERVLADDLNYFALPEHYASGFYALKETLTPSGEGWVKGQVTGPISFGLTVTDQDLRASLYHDDLVDVIIKNTIMASRWQIHKLKDLRPNVMLIVDEPYRLSAYWTKFSKPSIQRAHSLVFIAAPTPTGLCSSIRRLIFSTWTLTAISTI
jgi:hypothetical protein